MFGRKIKNELRMKTNQTLLDLIYAKKEQWDRAKQTESVIDEIDDELRMQTKLARAKYLFLYKAAKARQVSSTQVFTEFQKHL